MTANLSAGVTPELTPGQQGGIGRLDAEPPLGCLGSQSDLSIALSLRLRTRSIGMPRARLRRARAPERCHVLRLRLPRRRRPQWSTAAAFSSARPTLARTDKGNVPEKRNKKRRKIITAEEARKDAQDAATQARKGGDPAAEKLAVRADLTGSELVELYLKDGYFPVPPRRHRRGHPTEAISSGISCRCWAGATSALSPLTMARISKPT